MPDPNRQSLSYRLGQVLGCLALLLLALALVANVVLALHALFG